MLSDNFYYCRHRVLQHSTVLNVTQCLALQATVQRSEEPMPLSATPVTEDDMQCDSHTGGMTVSVQLDNIASQYLIQASVLQVSAVSKMWRLQRLSTEQSSGKVAASLSLIITFYMFIVFLII